MPYNPPDWIASGCAIQSGAEKIATIPGFECIFKVVLNVFIGLVGLGAFFLFIVGGIKYLTSGGDSKAVQSATQTITISVAGVFLAVISWLILQLIRQFTGVETNIFQIPR